MLDGILQIFMSLLKERNENPVSFFEHSGTIEQPTDPALENRLTKLRPIPFRLTTDESIHSICIMLLHRKAILLHLFEMHCVSLQQQQTQEGRLILAVDSRRMGPAMID